MSLLVDQGQGSGPTLVWLHGFTQTKDSAHRFRSILAGTNDLLALDLPGHGRNWSIHLNLAQSADWLADLLPEGPVSLAGYSFGARVALHFALRHPRRVERLVLLGATRGIQDPEERRRRRERDDSLAKRIREIGTEAFLDEWLAQPLFRDLPEDPEERRARSANAAGLAASLRLAGTGTQAWLGPLLSTITAPTLALAGENDQKFSLEAAAIADTVRHGQVRLVPGAGHAAHLEQPEATAALVNEFIARA